MATAPEVPNFPQYDFKLDDTTEMITKDNGRNAALKYFGEQLKVMTDSINQDLTSMGSLKSDTEAAAQSADEDAQQIALDKQAVADDRAHVDQQKQAVDTTAGEVSDNAQQVALDKQAVADDRQAAAQSAQSADQDATAAQQAKTDAEALYGDLQAVDDAKTTAQQAATDAGDERGLAETARQGAEQALSDTETVRDEAQQTVSQAITDHEAETDPHSQYAKSADLGSAAAKNTGTGASELPTTNEADQRYLRAGQNLPNDVFPSGTVVQQKYFSINDSTSTTSSLYYPLTSTVSFPPLRNDTHLVFVVQMYIDIERQDTRAGCRIISRFYDGAEYVNIGNTSIQELASISGVSEVTQTLIRRSVCLIGELDQNQLRPDNGSWTFRVYGSCYYADSSETLTMNSANICMMEVVN